MANGVDAAADPVEQLIAELMSRVEKTESSVKRDGQRLKEYRATLDRVVKAKGDFEKAVEEYRKNRGALQEQLDDLWRYRDDRYEASRRAVGEEQARDLDKRFRRYNKDLERLEADLANHEGRLAQSESDVTVAEGKLAAHIAAFEGLRDREKAIKDRFKTLEDLKERLDAACDDARHALRYVLILEFDLVLRNIGRDPDEDCTYWTPGEPDSRPPLYSARTFRAKLVAASRAVYDAQEDLRKAKESDAQLRERIAATQGRLTTARAERVDKVAPKVATDEDDGDGDGNGNGNSDGNGNGDGDGDGDGNGNGNGNGKDEDYGEDQGNSEDESRVGEDEGYRVPGEGEQTSYGAGGTQQGAAERTQQVRPRPAGRFPMGEERR